MRQLMAVALVTFSPLISTADFKIGDKVFVKPGAEATIGGTVVYAKSIPMPATILEIKDDKVVLETVWVRKSDLLTADEALEFYNEQVAEDPSNSMSFVNRGNVKGAKDDFDGAFRDFNEAIKLDPNNARAYLGRGIIWAKRLEMENAIKDLTEAIRLDSSAASAYTARGTCLRSKSDFDAAIKDCSEAIKLNPADTTAFYNRGACWDAKGKFDNAITDFTEAIRCNPIESFALNGIAWIRATCLDGKYRNGKNAVEYATKACELTRWEEWNTLDTLAAAYAEFGDYANAIKWQEETVELYPSNNKIEVFARLELYRDNKPYRDMSVVQVLLLNSVQLGKNDEFDDAIKECTEAIRLAPNVAVSYACRGCFFVKTGEVDSAMNDYSEAIRLNPEDVKSHNNRGILRVSKGEYENAVKDYSEAIRLDGFNSEAYMGRGNAWLKMDAFEFADADFSNALLLNPSSAAIQTAIASMRSTCPDVRYRDGETSGEKPTWAVGKAIWACELTEWKLWRPLNKLAAAYAESGDFPNAVKWAEKALELVPEEDKERVIEPLNFYRANKRCRKITGDRPI